ncbi:MAG: hypothetical protein AAB863_00645 [Patescibacteria group bacterium]
MRLYFLLLSLVFLGACNKEPQIDRTQRPISVVDLASSQWHEGAVFTTIEAPISLPHTMLKKVSVQRNKQDFRLTAFVEPDQAQKIMKQGQRVKLYGIEYYYSSTGNPQYLILARVE